jgi:hypothetical protein
MNVDKIHQVLTFGNVPQSWHVAPNKLINLKPNLLASTASRTQKKQNLRRSDERHSHPYAPGVSQ